MGEKSTAISPAHANILFNNRDMYDIVVVDDDGTDKKAICSQLKHQVAVTRTTKLLVGMFPSSSHIISY